MGPVNVRALPRRVGSSGKETNSLPWLRSARQARLRYSHEHGYRFDKQVLLWDQPRLRTPEQTERWTQVVACAHNQLVLARPLVEGIYRPWETRRSLGPDLAAGATRHANLFATVGNPGTTTATTRKSAGTHQRLSSQAQATFFCYS